MKLKLEIGDGSERDDGSGVVCNQRGKSQKRKRRDLVSPTTDDAKLFPIVLLTNKQTRTPGICISCNQLDSIYYIVSINSFIFHVHHGLAGANDHASPGWVDCGHDFDSLSNTSDSAQPPSYCHSIDTWTTPSLSYSLSYSIASYQIRISLLVQSHRTIGLILHRLS